ncbi:hypothetical protein CBR_g27856 [Chara braunii]|uniref:Uncharacterized protein n=1 Tax=Chara braunii TaxID=69332 RepID=A0A388L8I7_CHABU|nr:hypothetical protein CBR_g27856 [Chara braunii]|eukprot:GBG78631.1 hypothetical protein CBR_g27856 [Chara braunii]
MVETRSGKSTTPYTQAQEEQAVAILRERKEKETKKELIRQANKLVVQEEQAAKKRKLEEEMERLKEEEEKMKEVEEEEIEEEEPLLRRSAEQRGETSDTKKDASWLEKKVSEWVANLSLGEEEEAMLYVPLEEKEVVIREWEEEKDPLRHQTIEEGKKLERKLRLTRENKRRMEEANKVARELGVIKVQEDIQGKLDVISRNIELLARAWDEQHQFSRAQDIALHFIRLGFRDCAREMMLHVGAEVQARIEGTEKFCRGAIEGAKLAVPKEEEPR